MIDKCKTCANGYPSVSCINCGSGLINYVKDGPLTNAQRIRGMSDEELAKEMLFFRPTDAVFIGTNLEGRPCYMGLASGYYETAEEAIQASLDWLRQPAETEGTE